MATYKIFTNDDGVEVDIRSDIPETLARLTALEGVTGKTILGAIIMFSGSFDDDGYPYPTGTTVSDKSWHICDGTHGTPNLIGSFIKGVAAADIGGTGGAESQIVSGSVTLSGATGSTESGGTIGGTSLEVGQLASHGHTERYGRGWSSSYYTRAQSCIEGRDGSNDSEEWTGTYASHTSSSETTANTGSGSQHTHSITGTGHTHELSGTLSTGDITVNTVPPYYALAYIMKIA